MNDFIVGCDGVKRNKSGLILVLDNFSSSVVNLALLPFITENIKLILNYI